jgi:hypothetical protein
MQSNSVFCWGGEKNKPGLDQDSLIEKGCVAMCTGILKRLDL